MHSSMTWFIEPPLPAQSNGGCHPTQSSSVGGGSDGDGGGGHGDGDSDGDGGGHGDGDGNDVVVKTVKQQSRACISCVLTRMCNDYDRHSILETMTFRSIQYRYHS